MEAKGCAKPAQWKTARRFYYWAVRARLARSAALQALSEASPGATYEYRTRLLNNLTGIEPPTEQTRTNGELGRQEQGRLRYCYPSDKTCAS